MLPVSYGLDEHLPKFGCNPLSIYFHLHFHKTIKGENKGKVYLSLQEIAQHFKTNKENVRCQLNKLANMNHPMIVWSKKAKNQYETNEFIILRDKNLNDFKKFSKMLSATPDSKPSAVKPTLQQPKVPSATPDSKPGAVKSTLQQPKVLSATPDSDLTATCQQPDSKISKSKKHKKLQTPKDVYNVYDVKDDIIDTTKVVSETHLVFKYFCNKYKETFNKDYIASFAKDNALLKSLLKIIPLNEMYKLIDRFFESTDPFILKSSYDVGIFRSQINKLIRGVDLNLTPAQMANVQSMLKLKKKWRGDDKKNL